MVDGHLGCFQFSINMSIYIFMFVWDFVELILRGGIAGPKVIYVCFFFMDIGV